MYKSFACLKKERRGQNGIKKGMSALFFGVGKPRSKFGKFIDKKDIAQLEVEKASGLSRATISRICNDKNYQAKYSTIQQLKQGMEKLGINVDDSYFNM